MYSSREILKILLLSVSLFYGVVQIAYAIYVFIGTNSLDILFSQLPIFYVLPFSLIGIWIAANIANTNFLSKSKISLVFRVATVFVLALHARTYISDISLELWPIDGDIRYSNPFMMLHEVIVSLCLIVFLVCPSLEKSAHNSEAFS